MGEEVENGWEIKDRQASGAWGWRLGIHKGKAFKLSPPYTTALRARIRALAIGGINREQKIGRTFEECGRKDLALWWAGLRQNQRALLVETMAEPEADASGADEIPALR